MWQLRDSEIVRDDARVSAVEVLAALTDDGGSTLRRDVPEIRFSRMPLEVRVRVSGNFPEGLLSNIVARKAGALWNVVPNCDHIVVAGTWHPLETTSLFAARNICPKDEQAGLSAGDYIRLLTVLAPGSVLDETTHEMASEWGKHRDSMSPPIGLNAELFPYQTVGSTAMRILARLDLGTLLADEMGLGKTVQAIALLLDQRERGPSLVVAPAALLANWRRELMTFAPGLTFLVHAGPRRAGSTRGLQGYDVVVTSYDSVLNDIAFMEDIHWNIVAIDEAQFIKNPDAQRAKAVKRLDRRVSVAISGTPFENSLIDLWSISEFVLPQMLGDRSAFEALFPDQDDAAHEAGRLVAPITIRRPVSEVATDLPPRWDSLTPLDPSEEDLANVRRVRDDSRAFGGLVEQLVICAHGDDDSALPTIFAGKPKVEYAISLITEAVASGDKVLVFAGYQATLDRLASSIHSELPEIYLAVIDGRMPADDRVETIDTFSAADAGCLLLNPDAAGVGLNITAANHVIHFNPEWNPAVTAQATARAFRRRRARLQLKRLLRTRNEPRRRSRSNSGQSRNWHRPIL